MLSSLEINTKIEDYLKKDSNIEFGYIFGSFADGTFNERSDIDIALYLKDESFDTQLTRRYNNQRYFVKRLR